MADDMEAGRWLETHQGIGLDHEGNLVDGQHRLSAIVLSGCEQWLWTWEGVTRAMMKVIDCGKIRSIPDALMIDGHHAGSTEVAIARRLLLGFDENTRQGGNRLEVMACLFKHWEAIRFAMPPVRTGRSKNASVLAPVAFAWYTQDHDRLREFLDCVANGVVEQEEDSAAATLYRSLYAARSALEGRGSQYRHDLFLRAVSALKAFVERRPLTKLYPATTNPFPLPSVGNTVAHVLGLPGEPSPPRSARTKKRQPSPDLFS
jgi:hypothetical protein